MNTLKDYVNFKLTHADKVAEAESYPLTLTNCKKYKKMRDLKVYGNSFQDGTPTPDNPIEVVSVGEKSVNLFDKDNAVSLYASTTAIYNVTETGISCYCTTSQKNIFLVMDLGLASNFEGKNMRATMNCPIVTNEKYSNTMFCTCEADGSNRKEIGSRTVTNGEVYAAATIGTGYTTQRLCLRLYVQVSDGITGYLKDTYYFNNIMVYEGTDKKAYEPYGKYKIPVVQRGINLLNFDAAIPSTVGNSFAEVIKNDDGSITMIKGAGHDRRTEIVSFDYIIPKGTTVTFSVRFLERQSVNDGDMTFFLSGFEIRTWMNGIDANGVFKRTITLDRDVSQWYISMVYSPEAGMSFTFDNLQLEYGDVATPYEPYVEPVTTNIFLDEPLRKLGDYSDYIDFKENKVVRNVRELVFKGGEIDNVFTDYAPLGYNLYRTKANFVNNAYTKNFNSWLSVYPEKSTHFKASTFLSSSDMKINQWAIRVNYALHFTLAPETYAGNGVNATAKDINNWLASQYENGTPVIFDYILVEPTEEPLNIDLPKLTTKTTIIEVDTSLAPSNIYGKYIKK